MTHHWDEFSKSLAQPLPRRESLRRLGIALAGTVLSPLGLTSASGAPKGPKGTDPCDTLCRCRRKSDQNQCLRACRACRDAGGSLVGSCGNYFCCGAGQTSCGSYCADLANDPYNCGACGYACDEPGPYEYGACIDGACRYACADGAEYCDGNCTFLSSDPNNCGACGNVCDGPNPSCYQGACSHCTPSCPERWCGGNGCGGECACPSGTYCEQNGWCYDICAPGFTWCDPGCVDLNSDSYNCGACGNVCEPGYVCSSGACWDPACQFGNC